LGVSIVGVGVAEVAWNDFIGRAGATDGDALTGFGAISFSTDASCGINDGGDAVMGCS
jgi:hypothetical protein